MDLGGKYSTNLTHWKNGVAIEIHRENYEILLWCKLHRKEVSRKNDKEAIVRVLIGVGIGITNFWELICFFIKKINW